MFDTHTMWGGFFILIGASCLIKSIFGIPVLRFVMGCFLVYVGITMVARDETAPIWHMWQYSSTSVFFAQHITPTDSQTVQSVCSHQIIDLSDLDCTTPRAITLNATCSVNEILVPTGVPTQIVTQSICSRVKISDQFTAFGTHTYRNSARKPQLLIVLNPMCSTVDLRTNAEAA